MFKLYRNFKKRDWLLVALILGFTVLQVWCTMTIVDYVRDVIESITFVNYHNHPELLGEGIPAMLQALGGWEGVINSGMLPAEMAEVVGKIAKASQGDIWMNAGLMLAFAGLMVLVQAIISVLASYVSADLSTTVRTKIYRKVDRFSLQEINEFSTPSLITRTTNDIQNVQITNVMMMRMVFAAPVTAIWAIIKIQASSVDLTVATSIAVAALLVFITMMIIVVLPKFKVVQKLIDNINGISRENLTGIRVIRAFNKEEYQTEKFAKANDELTKVHIFTGRVMSLMSPVMMLIMNGITLAIYWLGASLINKGTIDYATVTAFSTLSSQIIMSFLMLMMMFVLWPRASVCARRINEALEKEPSIVDPLEEEQTTSKGTIEFRNVSFKYPDGDQNVLSNLDFTIKQGETVAFIGATGSGKTSIINLITRFYDATEGEVIVDGVNVKNLKQSTLRSFIGLVPQKGFLFKGSIKENVALGDPNMSEENIINACGVAEAKDFIEAKENKYDFEISQGGTNVSGGQRQRLCIARALALHREIYIFDDSFSALDYKTDKKVRANLKETDKDSTKVIVAQRIGTIMDADKIIVVDNGKIEGVGTHKELLSNCKVYLDIALSQLSKEELGLCQE